MTSLFHSLFYEPLYNALVFLASILPGNDAGLAIVVLTLLVKLVLAPLSHKSMKAQKKLRDVEPELSKIKGSKKTSEEQAREMMELYRRHGVNPFSGFLLILIQFPIIIALYLVFRDGLNLLSPAIYAATPLPETINNLMFGLMDVTKPSAVMAVLAGISYYFQMKLAIPLVPKGTGSGSFSEELSRSMAIQTKYIVPVTILIISLNLSSGLPLYWFVSSIFAICHELYVRREAEKI